jgi:fructose-1,6-bisphosphatase/inositol monophosphatase family enzyme
MTAIDFAAFVDELATISGETIRPFFRSALGVENKSRSGGFDPVTAADRAAEAAMRTFIKRTFPEHGVVGEEFGADRPDAEYVWVLDPIDGTKSFICGMPAWGTLIALTRFAVVEKDVRLSRYGGDCYAYCVLAAGHVDLVIETELKPHDVLPLIPIIEGAGGIITTWENAPAHKGGRVIAAGDKRVHAQAMALLTR